MAKDAGWEKAFGRLSKAAQRSPHKIMGADNSAKSLTYGGDLSNGTCAIKKDEIDVFFWSFDKTRSKAPVTEYLFQVFRNKIASQIDLSGTEPGCNLSGAHSCPEFNRIQ